MLRQQHAELFNILGKTSGRHVDKLKLVKDAGFGVEERYGLQTLSGLIWVSTLGLLRSVTDSGFRVLACPSASQRLSQLGE